MRKFRPRASRKRPEIDGQTPVHVAIRVREGTLKLRIKRAHRIVRTALIAAGQRIRFRLIAYSIQNNHLHLIAEADDTYALSRAMRSLSIRIARRLNQVMGERGVRIPKRYSLSVLRSPIDVRTALAYVLNNYRRHEAAWGRRCPDGWVDPCSSGVWFEHWATLPNATADPLPEMPRPTTGPRSLYLDTWRMYGLIDPSEVPGPMKDRAKVSDAFRDPALHDR